MRGQRLKQNLVATQTGVSCQTTGVLTCDGAMSHNWATIARLCSYFGCAQSKMPGRLTGLNRETVRRASLRCGLDRQVASSLTLPRTLAHARPELPASPRPVEEAPT